MEQNSEEKISGGKKYKVFWHQNIKEDFEKISSSLIEKIVSGVEHKLSTAPLLIGEPLKGTISKLWKVAYSKYRIIYTINPKCHEVWVLSVMKREIVYQHAHVQAILQMALALHDKFETSDS